MQRITASRIGGALAIGVALGGAASAQEVGKASAVNPAATANTRVISIGTSIAHKERIRTAANGSVQLLFVDKTSMTIGPNSDLTIDEYVYNPNAGTGKLAATLGKGALRFVGGQISHTGEAEVKTASAVIGIRGGVALIGTGHVYAGYGSSTVTSGGSTVTLGAGEFTQIGGGGPPTPPGPPPAGFVLAQIRVFQSAAGQTGGVASGTASRGNVARAEARATGTPGAAVTGSLTPTPPVQPVVTQVNNTQQNLQQTIQTTSQIAAIEQEVRQTEDSRPTLSLTAWVGGLIRSVSPQGTASMGTMAGVGAVQLDGAGKRVQANFAGGSVDGMSGRAANLVGSYQYGSVDPSQSAQSDYASYDNFSANPAVRDGQPVSMVNGQPITDHRGSFVTVSGEQARQFAVTVGQPDFKPCVCDYTRWGTWTSDSKQNGYQDSVAGFWVAGRPINPQDMPTTGTATYTGHVAANVVNNGNAYIAGGNMINTVDFAARTGTVSVTGLDNTNYAGQLFLGTGSTQGSDAGIIGGFATGGNRSMALVGSFYQGRNSPVGEMGGLVALTGPGYSGGGIFAAQMK
jgi:hypothetical protein